MALTRVAGCERRTPLLILQYVIEGRALQARLHEAVDESTNQIGRYREGKRGGWRHHGVRPRPVRQWLQRWRELSIHGRASSIPSQGSSTSVHGTEFPGSDYRSRTCFQFGFQSSVTWEHLPSPKRRAFQRKWLFYATLGVPGRKLARTENPRVGGSIPPLATV